MHSLYDSTIRRSYSPPDPRWSYYWEVVADPSDAPMVLAGWAATPLAAADCVRHAMAAVDPQGFKHPVNHTHPVPKWPDGNFPTLKPADEPENAAIIATDDNLIATIAARRNDTAFMERLAKSIEAHRHVLDRLDGRVEFGGKSDGYPYD
jgi:hypothetical protein